MTDATQPLPKSVAEPRFVIDLRGEVSGMVAAGEYVYQQQVNVSDGGLVYVLEEGTVPFTKVERPVRSLPRADPPLLDRETEMAEVLGAVRPGGTVQVTAGPGGGRSLFLAHLAHRNLQVDDGVVHLKAKSQPLNDILFRLFYAFHDSRLPTAFVPPPPQIQRELAGIEAAIVIDDVDHLADVITELLDTATDAAFVVSSRRGLVDGGAEVALGGLPIAEASDLFARAHGEPMPDRARVRQLCSVLEGHPQCVVFAARLVRAEAIDPLTLAGEISGPDPFHRLAARLLASLPERESRVAALLAALDGAPVPVAQVTATTHVPGTQEVLRDLSRAAIAQSNSPRYAFNSLLLDAAEELWDLDEWRVSAADQLTGWLQQPPSADAVLEAAPMTLRLMTWATETGLHETTVALGQGVDSALALSGLWGSWEQALKGTLGSAKAMGDGAAAEGWALHQLGTRAMCHGEPSTADSLLNHALAIRQELGVQSAIDATQHNLDVLHLPPGGPPPPDTPPPPEPGPPPVPAAGIPALVKGVAAVAVVAAIAGAAWFAFGPDDEEGAPVAAGGLAANPVPLELVTASGSVVERSVIVANDGDEPVVIDFIDVEGDAFGIARSDCVLGEVLPGGEECQVFVAFGPPTGEDQFGALMIYNSGEPSLLEVPLVGRTVAGGALRAEPSGVAFGPVAVGTVASHGVDLYNDGDVPVIIEEVYLEAWTDFDIGRAACPSELDAGAVCSIEVLFNPPEQDDYSDRLVIAHSGEGSPLFVDLVASAFGAVDWTASPQELLFETFAEEGVHAQVTEITNTGTVFTEFEFIGTDSDFPFTVPGDPCSGGLDPGDTCEIVVEFESLDIGAYAEIAEEQDPGSLASLGMPVVMRHSGTLILEPAQGAGLNIPLIATTVAPFPDLVSRIDHVEPVGFDEHGWPIYYVVVTVTNVGGVPAEPADVGIEYYLPDTDRAWMVPLIDKEGTVYTGELAELGGEVTVEGLVTVEEFNLETGSPVVLSTYPDRCVDDEYDEECLVEELHEWLGLESNNWSEPVETVVPQPTIEVPDFSDLFDLVTTTTVIG